MKYVTIPAISLITALLFSGSFLYAQSEKSVISEPIIQSIPVGKDSNLWHFTHPADHHNSIVQITSGDGVGTGVVISIDKDKRIKHGHQGYCLTAWHVVQNDDNEGKITVDYRNGQRAKDCQVVAHDEAADLAIVWVWVPDEIQPAKIAKSQIKGGDGLEFAGLGGGSELSCCLRHFSGTASLPSSSQKIFADVPLLPGDSGGPVFNERNELVGVISGGWFWWDGGVRSEDGNRINATWPARAANLSPIRTLMADLQSSSTEVVNR